MSWTVSAPGANKARGQMPSCLRRRYWAGASVVLAIAFGGLQSPAFGAIESMGPGVTMPATVPPYAASAPASITRPEIQQSMPAGNPLWRVPLRVLTETRDRPLFSPSRRPPPAAVIAAPVVAPRPAPLAAPDHPLLTLIGTVVGGQEAIGIFVDQESKRIVRLKIGQNHDRWILRAVRERDTVFDDQHREATLALPATNAEGRPANSAVGPAQALSSTTWTDGAGRLVNSPKRANGTATPPYVHPATATWVDGDGQVISPPPVRY
jgi:general secretion pathway protein N